jgi:hypothetical protein
MITDDELLSGRIYIRNELLFTPPMIKVSHGKDKK